MLAIKGSAASQFTTGVGETIVFQIFTTGLGSVFVFADMFFELGFSGGVSEKGIGVYVDGRLCGANTWDVSAIAGMPLVRICVGEAK